MLAGLALGGDDYVTKSVLPGGGARAHPRCSDAPGEHTVGRTPGATVVRRSGAGRVQP
jgi:hypothetical protein